MNALNALVSLAVWTSIGWQISLSAGQGGELWCRLMGGSDRLERFWRAAARVHQEAWLFAPPGFLICTVQAWDTGHSWTIFFYAYSLYSWWRHRDWPEDNHWKRRAKKAKDAVAVRAGRLVVVPAGGSS